MGISNDLKKIKDILYELETGDAYHYRVNDQPEERGVYPNALISLDSYELEDTKGNAVRFTLSLNTLIGIVEKTEANNYD